LAKNRLVNETLPELNRPLPKLNNAGFARQFGAKQGAGDDAHPEGVLGIGDAGLRQIDRKDGVGQFPKRSNTASKFLRS